MGNLLVADNPDIPNPNNFKFIFSEYLYKFQNEEGEIIGVSQWRILVYKNRNGYILPMNDLFDEDELIEHHIIHNQIAYKFYTWNRLINRDQVPGSMHDAQNLIMNHRDILMHDSRNFPDDLDASAFVFARRRFENYLWVIAERFLGNPNVIFARNDINNDEFINEDEELPHTMLYGIVNKMFRKLMEKNVLINVEHIVFRSFNELRPRFGQDVEEGVEKSLKFANTQMVINTEWIRSARNTPLDFFENYESKLRNIGIQGHIVMLKFGNEWLNHPNENQNRPYKLPEELYIHEGITLKVYFGITPNSWNAYNECPNGSILL